MTQLLCFGSRRNIHQSAGLEIVDVAGREGLRILAQQRQHHLVLGHTLRFSPFGNFPQGIINTHVELIVIAGQGTGSTQGRSRSGGSGLGCNGRLCARRSQTLSNRRGIKHRRIQQQGIFAHQTSAGPIHLNHEIEERLLHRLGRFQPNTPRAFGRYQHLKLNIAQIT